jgi:hypothetical protein
MDGGLNEAEGLNLNSLASTFSFEVEDFDVCLLCIANSGLPKAIFASFHVLLIDAALECRAEV